MRPGPHGPGNIMRPPVAGANDSRFNEAGAARPRKYANAMLEDIRLDCASMRPGPHGPGNLSAARPVRTSPACFNEAGAARPRKSGTPRPHRRKATGFNEAGAARPRKYGGVGQVRGFFRRFNEAGAARPRKSPMEPATAKTGAIASMRPGPHGPGNGGGLARPPAMEKASMRPGPHGPGNIDTSVHSFECEQLQ